MKYLIGSGIGLALLVAFAGSPAAMADSVFTIENPAVDFEVIDADDGSGDYFFDGIGDFVFPTYNDAALGTFGEARSMAEFDLSGFSVPAGEIITSAFLEVKFSSVGVYGLGINGESPDSLAVDGYIGDGVAAPSDFQIADGNLLASVAPLNPQVGDVLRFPITDYVTQFVDGGNRWLGLTLRAETFGGDMFEEHSWDVYPKLTIQTGVPEPGSLLLCALGLPFLLRRR